ncbi:MAG: cytochrome ubiquinol oxidase subunit I [Gemmatimonadota bacterium]
MTDLLSARAQMGVSLAFHIVFAAIGIAMPLLMVVAEWRWRRTRDPIYRTLARQWAKGTAIFFAVGAVSGTVLSFELGLLWPAFMEHAGALIGMPFSLEGFAFFTEAIFLGIYLYGWERVPERAHLAAGVMVALSGAASAFFVMTANAWMNSPAGFELVDGRFTEIDPVAAMFNPAWKGMTVHMVIAAYLSVGFGVAGVHAWLLRRDPRNRLHRAALGIALAMGAPMALLQPISGDLLARSTAIRQPIKLAAMEGHFETQRGAPLRIGGIPDAEAGRSIGAIEIPKALSLLTFHDPNAEVRGLEEFPRDEWPPLLVVRLAWQLMVAIGTFLAVVAVVAGWRWRRRPDPLDARWFVNLLALCAPLGFVALEAGWVVTEVGRQPWIIYGVMRTADAVTPMPHLVVPFLAFTLLYIGLAVIVTLLMRRMVLTAGENGDRGGHGGIGL